MTGFIDVDESGRYSAWRAEGRMINRKIANMIRTVLDSGLPAFLRDNQWFMYPLFFVLYRGKNVRKYMTFKAYAHSLSPAEFRAIYEEVGSLTSVRETDLNSASLEYILSQLDKNSKTLLDVGCGSVFFLKKAQAAGFEVTGADIAKRLNHDGIPYHQSSIEKLPFADGEFDIVTCLHTLEHVLDPKIALRELKRVAKKQLVIVVPCQRYFFLTFDLHLHFFPEEASLVDLIDEKHLVIKKLDGDWNCIATLENAS